MPSTNNKCPICCCDRLAEILDGYLFCRKCKTAWYTSASGLTPASPTENNEPVFQSSKTALFSSGLNTIFKLTGKKGRILDLGCGHGYFLQMARDAGWEPEGIEITKQHADYGRSKFGVTIYDKPLSELKLPENSYDALTLWSVFDVLPDPLGELNEIYRVLKPGGILYMKINNLSFNYPMLQLGRTRLFQILRIRPGIVLRWGITKKTLETLFSRTNFKRVHIYNSKMTSGDPYGTGGRLGGIVVAMSKHLYYILSQIVFYVSFGKAVISSSLIVTARKQ